MIAKIIFSLYAVVALAIIIVGIQEKLNGAEGESWLKVFVCGIFWPLGILALFFVD